MLMALLDSIVGARFRDEKAGRVIVFSGDRRTRGYVVRSESDELKIRSFLKMFYFAHFSILLLGYFLASEWSRGIYRALGRPEAHLFRAMCISTGVYFAVVGIPYFLLWRAYKKAFVSFVSLEDEVFVSGRRAGRQQMFIFIAAGLILLGLAVLLAFAVSYKS
jgi:ABC-type arginine transport system permease subunit